VFTTRSEAVGRSVGHEYQASTEITQFTIEHHAIRLALVDFGATLFSLEVMDRADAFGNVVMGGLLESYLDPADRRGYRGATVGRYANRIGGSSFELGGVRHELHPNEGDNQLHGGPVGFDQFVWDSKVESGDDYAAIHFHLASPDGHGGYPGALDVDVSFVVDARPSLTIEYSATTDASTVVNLTNHAYWNLAGGGEIWDHVLRLGSDHFLPVDEGQIPTGELAEVSGTRFDFRTPATLRQAQDGGADHCFVLDRSEPAADLFDPASGRRMIVHTDQPGLQVYTANYLEDPHTAICLETQAFPDSPNRADFPSTVLAPGDRYRQTTRFEFSAE